MKRLVSFFKETEQELAITTDDFYKMFAGIGFKLMQAVNRFKNETLNLSTIQTLVL